MAEPRPAGESGVLVARVSLWDLFVAFSKISARGWGGGSGTIYVMHRELVRRGWITSAQFGLDFGLSRIVPGINLLALAVMLGYRLNGPLGSLVSIAAFMLPASLITLVATMGFVEFTANPIGEALVRGAVPVTAALTFSFAYDTGRAVMPWRERLVALLMATYIASAFILVVVFHVSVALIIVAGALGGAFLFRPSGPEAPSPLMGGMEGELRDIP